MIITILRKPLEGSVAENTLKHGCGAINIDDTRIRGEVPSVSFTRKVDYPQIQEKGKAGWSKQRGGLKGDFVDWKPNTHGRWPANFILIHKDCVESCPVKEIDRQSGISKSTGGRIGNKDGGGIYGGGKGLKGSFSKGDPGIGDTGGASRFFKQFKKEDNQ